LRPFSFGWKRLGDDFADLKDLGGAGRAQKGQYWLKTALFGAFRRFDGL
jgi:hypothetical protein